MYARIKDNTVIETISVMHLPSFPANFVWVKCLNDVQIGYTYKDGVFTPPDDTPTPEEIKQQLYDYAAAKRTAIDNMTLTVGEIEILGDDTTRYSIVETLSFLETQDVSTTVTWQAENGFFTLDYDGLKTLGLAIAARRQASFITKKAVFAAIADGSITTETEIAVAFTETAS